MYTLTTTTLAFTALLHTTHAQKIYIDTVPAYAQLPACAEVPLSTIVRDMNAGKCGDGGKETSFSCFCGASSTVFNSYISEAVSSRCMPQLPDATAQALEVFDSYCHLSAVPVTTAAGSNTSQGAATTTTRGAPAPTRSQMGPIPSSGGALGPGRWEGGRWWGLRA
ncbi:hypothetical protein QBC34DRAFT_436967 [Podospora aff. communis PSN243]|uniref:Extracellular membrane protein CFEM domain-containing protein n=1 Tax=Podospora aff. communis PSN243 TaxID=3040156 RepID=A0AAV9GUA2_9PEZI|nr:hypothetical protein QBC34DRAFT_436967 [Podospora aff. communis PSN243]